MHRLRYVWVGLSLAPSTRHLQAKLGSMKRTPNGRWRRLLTLLGILVGLRGHNVVALVQFRQLGQQRRRRRRPDVRRNPAAAGHERQRDRTVRTRRTDPDDPDGAQPPGHDRDDGLHRLAHLATSWWCAKTATDIVWQLSEESAAPSPTPTTLTFAPNETQTFTTTWDQIESDSGDQAPVGAYEARGVLVFDGFDNSPLRASQLGSQLERFTIN